MHLNTDMYIPNGTTFIVRPEDWTAHIAWQASVNQRLPTGSNYTIEIGHNGNGAATNGLDTLGICHPETAIYYADQVDTPLEFQKPLGTGTSLWPTTPQTTPRVSAVPTPSPRGSTIQPIATNHTKIWITPPTLTRTKKSILTSMDEADWHLRR
jgi:hypothetical protein